MSWTICWHMTIWTHCGASVGLFESKRAVCKGLSTRRSPLEIEIYNFQSGKLKVVRTQRVDVTNSVGKGFLTFKQEFLRTSLQRCTHQRNWRKWLWGLKSNDEVNNGMWQVKEIENVFDNLLRKTVKLCGCRVSIVDEGLQAGLNTQNVSYSRGSRRASAKERRNRTQWVSEYCRVWRTRNYFSSICVPCRVTANGN